MSTHRIDPAFEVALSELFDLAVQCGYTGGPPEEPITYKDCKEKRRITRVTLQGVELFTEIWRPETRHQWITEFVAMELVYVEQMESLLWDKKKKCLRKDAKDPLFFRQLLRDRPHWKNASNENSETWFYGYRMYLDPNPPQQETKEKPIFPTPPGTPWEDVTIDFVSEYKIKVKAKGLVEQYSYDEIGNPSGFQDRRNGGPNKVWNFFHILAMRAGIVTSEDFTNLVHDPNKVTAYVTRLRKALRDLTGIKDDPFYDFKAEQRYLTKFTLQATYVIRDHKTHQSELESDITEIIQEDVDRPKILGHKNSI